MSIKVKICCFLQSSLELHQVRILLPKVWMFKTFRRGCHMYIQHLNVQPLKPRDWSPKFETGINIIIKSTLYSIFWQDSITNIKINSFQIFWRLCNPFFWEYTKDLLGVYFGYNGGVFGLYLSYSGAILELYWGYLILGL